MNNLFFWIIVCSWLIPVGIRMYRRSQQRRIRNSGYPDGRFQEGGYPGRLPDYIAGQYPPAPQPYQAPQQYEAPQRFGPPQQAHAGPPSSPVPAPAPAAPSGPQGYRARKLAELDRQFSDGKIAMEEYMKLRQEIMNG